MFSSRHVTAVALLRGAGRFFSTPRNPVWTKGGMHHLGDKAQQKNTTVGLKRCNIYRR